MNDEISRIGVYGMGGVGKTTIITHINNRLLRDANLFHYVHWVNVSKASSVYKLQGDIAKVLDLDLSKEEDERKRAAKLWQTLNKRKKFVLILDDMWESFELEEAGISISIDGGKLLLTTRKHGVCKRMKCDEIVKVEPLSEREARNLFIKESGHQIDNDSNLENIIESVAKECDGPPLAIVVVARSMREFEKICEWRNLLLELRKPFEEPIHEMEEKVFKLLKASYDCLGNEKYRQCLLYCSLYLEDHKIVRNDIIAYWIGEGLVDEMESRQAEFDKGNSIINELTRWSLSR